MKYCSVAETAKKWGLSERTVRNYCANGRIKDAMLKGKTWYIPEDAQRPDRINRRDDSPKTLKEYLKYEKKSNVKGGIYHKIQVDMTYNSNHIEGSRLTHDQTRYIYETNTIGMENGGAVNIDDIVETVNHFRCIDLVIDNADRTLSESFIKLLHKTLKTGTSDSRKEWFAVGDYKRFPNEVGGHETAEPENVADKMKHLLERYNKVKEKTLNEIIQFHYEFEAIHPFQDGNGRIGRLILFKECLRNEIVPFIIDDDMKMFYYRGLHEWEREQGYLTDTCLTEQDRFKKYLDYFRIEYQDQDSNFDEMR